MERSLIVDDRDWELHINFSGLPEEHAQWEIGKYEFNLNGKQILLELGRRVQHLFQDIEEKSAEKRRIYRGPRFVVYLELGEIRVLFPPTDSSAYGPASEQIAPWQVKPSNKVKRANWEGPKHIPDPNRHYWCRKKLDEDVVMTCVWWSKSSEALNSLSVEA